MILRELVDYYDYLCANQPGAVVQRGWSKTRVSCFINLNEEGDLLGLIPVSERGGVLRYVPEQVKRSSGVAPNYLCDTPAYLLGFGAKGKPERAKRCFEASKALHMSLLKDVESPIAQAICRFYNRWSADDSLNNPAVCEQSDVLLAGRNLAFMVNGTEAIDDTGIREAWLDYSNAVQGGESLGRCLVTGRRTEIARLHPAIKGVAGGQSMGTSLVSFNEPSFASYGYDDGQGYNAPVGEDAAFAYSAALNYLITDQKHHIRLGDTTIVYWAGAQDNVCSSTVFGLFGGNGFVGASQPEEDPDEVIDSIMKEIRRGGRVNEVDPKVPFYVLGVAPNAARLAIRFFERSTFGQVIENIAAHYDRLSVSHAPYERNYLSPYWLLKAVAPPKSKQDPASSVLAGSLMRAILANQPYPEALYRNAMMRVFATQDDADARIQKVSYPRVAIIKAYLNKNHHLSEKEFTVSLDITREDEPYVLGRLFAVYERIQSRANPSLNSTVKDRYFNAACTTPGVVFPVLAKLSESHLAKLRKGSGTVGSAIALSKELEELYGKLDSFPNRLSLTEQGAFVLGYHHQYQDYFTRNQDK